jgi:trigger factor
MKLSITPAPKSSVQLEIELPPDRLDSAITDAAKRLSRRTRVAGFRPGKAPRIMLERVLGPTAVLDEAVEHLVSDSYRSVMRDLDVTPLTQPEVDVLSSKEGEPLVYKATVQIRPMVRLGDYKQFNFAPEIETIDDPKVDKVLEELRDQNAILEPVEGRAAEKGDYAVIAFQGTRDGQPFEGGTSERMPLVIGDERLIPGFEDHLIGLRVGDQAEFDITFPEDYAETSLAGQTSHFSVDVKELRAKVLPELGDDFAQELGPYESLDALRVEVRKRLQRNALDKARHAFADRIIEYAVANASLDMPDAVVISETSRDARGLPDVLIDQEVEVMHDEFRSNLARQGISEEAYTKVTGQSHEDLHAELRPRAEERVKVLLVLSKVAEAEGVEISAEDVEGEVEQARRRYADNPKLLRYFDSERGRNFIRSTLRRSRTVERIVDEWLTAHPGHPALPHADAEVDRSVLQSPSVASAGAIEASDPLGGDQASIGEPSMTPSTSPTPTSAEESAADKASESAVPA